MSKRDWYEEGYNQVISSIVEETGVTPDQARGVYSVIQTFDLIDYDVEKEIFHELVFGQEGEELDE